MTLSSQPGRHPQVFAGIEPDLDDVLKDPIVQDLMRLDHVTPAEIETLIRTVRERIVHNRRP